MNILDFNQSGGFPISTEILAAMQASYRSLNELGKISGDLTIISGCDVTGGVASDGFVVIAGELLFFKGATVGTHVIVQQVAEAQQGFEDGSAKSIIYERYATFGTATNQYEWANFKRPLTLLQIEQKLTNLENMVPIGLVAIWDRPADAIPAGWVEHTDLAGRTAVGHLDQDTNFGAIGGNIGTAQVTLDITQIPEHDHVQGTEGLYNDYGGGTTTGNKTYNAGAISSWRNAKTSKAGGGQPHSNIQPSRIVKYIRFVGFN